MKAKNKVDAYNDIVTINNRDYNITSNKDVLVMQQTLHNLGYNIPVTGRYDRSSINIVKQYMDKVGGENRGYTHVNLSRSNYTPIQFKTIPAYVPYKVVTHPQVNHPQVNHPQVNNPSTVSKKKVYIIPKPTIEKLTYSPQSLYVAPVVNNSDIPEEPPSKLDEMIGDLKGVFSGSIGDIIEKVRNSFHRIIDNDDSQKSVLQSKPTQSKPIQKQYQPNIIGDTIPQQARFGSGKWYIAPADINLNDTTVHYTGRNRGDYTPYYSKHGISLPVYKGIQDYVQATNNTPGVRQARYADQDGNVNLFIGYDKLGHLKIGNLKIFKPGDQLAQTYYSYFNNFIRDKNGKLDLKPAYPQDGNRWRPVFNGLNENGTPDKEMPLFLMTGRHKETDQFGHSIGGQVIVGSGNEYRLLRGSIDNVVSSIEKFQKSHKNKPIQIIELDNGSYSRGLSTLDGKITSDDLHSYYNQNSGATGDGAIILSNKLGGKFQQGGELNYTHNRFPITKSLNLNVVYDPKFQPKRDINPNFGDVEYMTAEHNVLPYYHNYKKPAQYKNKSTIIYNNNLGDTANESVALDALSHGLREQDKDWKEYFLPNLTKVWSKNDYVLGDLDKNGDDPLGNAVDGNIRNLLVQDKYRHQMRYSPIQEVYKATVHTPQEKKAWSEAYEYITGNKVLPNGKSLIVTPRGSYISK